MRYTLKPYQEEASQGIMENLEKSRNLLKSSGLGTGFALAAPTGSGKTVIASDVIETLVKGRDSSTAWEDTVILWFSDSPDLNSQSKHRISESSGQLYGHLEDITSDFSEVELEPQNVYFINTQKFSKNSKLIRRPVTASMAPEGLFGFIPPDARQIGIWEIIANTINNKEKTVIMIVDEAHRGLGSGTRERNTILNRLITGHISESGTVVPPMPIVFGISATPDRFRKFLHGIDSGERLVMGDVSIDPAVVQSSGLLKESIILNIPDEKGDYSTNLLAEATNELKDMTNAWHDHCTEERLPIVIPLMVVQVPDKVTEDQLTEYVRTIRDTWDIPDSSFAHVFGEHNDLVAGIHIPYIRPESLQDATMIKVVFAKEAISTGWDCPRAEVLVSFRPANDDTNITQILGRMVRTPLARSIPGNDVLNSTTCILPLFRKEAAMKVATMLSRDGEVYKDDDGTGGGFGRRVHVNPVTLTPDDHPEECRLMDSIPSYHLPTRVSRPITRLLNLATELERDNFYKNADAEVSLKLHKKMDGLMAQYSDEIDAEVNDINEVSVARVVRGLHDNEIQEESITLDADVNALIYAYRDATKAFGKQLANDYVNYLLKKQIASGDIEEEDIEEELLEIRTSVAGLSRVPDAVNELLSYASGIADSLTSEYRISIEGLSEERLHRYSVLRDMSLSPVEVSMKPPSSLITDDTDRSGSKIPVYKGHLLADGSGNAPIPGLNEWEKKVISVESSKSSFSAFYRNPQSANNDPSSLAIPYQDDGEWKLMKPDFLVFNKTDDGVAVSIVDPHGDYLADSKDKLIGLSDFAEKHGDKFMRIDSVVKKGSGKNAVYRVINLKDPAVRESINKGDSLADIYSDSKKSNEYR